MQVLWNIPSLEDSAIQEKETVSTLIRELLMLNMAITIETVDEDKH